MAEVEALGIFAMARGKKTHVLSWPIPLASPYLLSYESAGTSTCTSSTVVCRAATYLVPLGGGPENVSILCGK